MGVRRVQISASRGPAGSAAAGRPHARGDRTVRVDPPIGVYSAFLTLIQLVDRPSVRYLPFRHFATVPSRSRSHATRNSSQPRCANTIAALPRASRERNHRQLSGCGETPCSLTIASVRISCLSANFVQHEPNSVDDQRGLICDDIMTTARADNPKGTATGREPFVMQFAPDGQGLRVTTRPIWARRTGLQCRDDCQRQIRQRQESINFSRSVNIED